LQNKEESKHDKVSSS